MPGSAPCPLAGTSAHASSGKSGVNSSGRWVDFDFDVDVDVVGAEADAEAAPAPGAEDTESDGVRPAQPVGVGGTTYCNLYTWYKSHTAHKPTNSVRLMRALIFF